MQQPIGKQQPPGKQQAKSQRAQDAICDAAIESLFDSGYADTTLNKVARMAGFSKGALQHHYAAKEDLIVATADKLLQRSISSGQRSRSSQMTVEESLMWSWKKMVNTSAYRALLEILNAARADDELKERISEKLLAWGRAMDQQAVDTFEAIDGNEEDVQALMNMTRSFMRGLVIQERYSADPNENLDHVTRWIALIAPSLKLRNL